MGDLYRRRPPLAHEKEKDTNHTSGDKIDVWKSDERSSICGRRSPIYDKKYSYDEEKHKYDDKRTSLNEKRTSYGDKSYPSRSSYDYSDKRASYDEKKTDKGMFSDKKDSREKMSEKKSLYDDHNTSYVTKRPSYTEKKSLYEEKPSLYDNIPSVEDRKSPTGDWKSRVKDKKSIEKSVPERKSSTCDRKSSDEDWELSDDLKRSISNRKSPVRERKPTIEIWRPKSDKILSKDKCLKSEDDWDTSAYRRPKIWNPSSDSRRSDIDKLVSSEDWDSPQHGSANNWKSSSDLRKSTDDKKLVDKEWDAPVERSFKEKKSYSDQRKSAGDKLSSDDWDSRQRSNVRKSFDSRKSTDDRLSDEDWDSTHQRSSSNRSYDQRTSESGIQRSFERKSLDSKQTSYQQKLPGNEKRLSDGYRKASDDDWEYSVKHKSSISESKSGKDRKLPSEDWKPYNKKSYGDDKKLSDDDWESPAHRRSTDDRKSASEWKFSEDDQKSVVRSRLSGNDRKTSSNEKKSYLPDISHILELIEKVKLRNEVVMTDMLCEAEEEIKHCVSHPEYTRVMIMKLYDRCKEDQEFGLRAAALCGMIHNLKFGELSVKAVLLRCVQHDLEEKEHERDEEFQVLNSIFFLSELYYHMRINNLPISILGDALLNHLQPLLLGEETEFELLATCLIVNGSILIQDQLDHLNRLMIKIRSSLIKDTLSTKCRGYLLLIIELVSREFAPLLPETCKWYRSLLGSSTFEKFERLKPLPPERRTAR